MPDTPSTAGFTDVWGIARDFAGWLTDDQARLLWDSAAAVPADGLVLEIGSHQGKSTGVLAAALDPQATLVAVDPFEEGFGPGPTVARQRFEDNLTALGVRARVDLRAVPSEEALAGWTEPIDLLYIDGAHDYRNVVHDLAWTAGVRPGGRVLVHDAFSSVGVTSAFLTHVVASDRLRYVGRAQSMAEFEVAAPSAADRRRMLAQLPWFVRNVTLKVLLTLHLDGVARSLGHDQGRDFPY